MDSQCHADSGKFYEIIDEDADAVQKIGLRKSASGLAGFPKDVAAYWIQKLVHEGFILSVADQVAVQSRCVAVCCVIDLLLLLLTMRHLTSIHHSNSKKSAQFERPLKRIITPGTYIQGELEPYSNSLLAIYAIPRENTASERRIALCWTNLVTNEVRLSVYECKNNLLLYDENVLFT